MAMASVASLRRPCILLRLRPELFEEYRESPRAARSRMLTALRETGRRDDPLFHAADGPLVDTAEAQDVGKPRGSMSPCPVNQEWQSAMGRFFADGPDDEPLCELPLLLRLESAIAQCGCAHAQERP